MEKGEAKVSIRKRLCAMAAGAAVLLGAAVAASGPAAMASTAPTVHAATAPAAPRAITFSDCPGQTTTWVDLDIITAAGLADWCFHGTGIWTFHSPNNEITNFCSGNNRGHLSYYLPDGQLTGFSFGPGRLVSFAFGNHIYQLNMTGSSGGDVCRS
jgi:hypothetical protein